MSIDSAHKSRWETFKKSSTFSVAIALQFVVPLSLGFRLPGLAFIVGGAALFTLGVILVIRARREFARQGQPTDPGHPTTRVVTTGVFSISRNPLYLGVACILGGIGLALNLPWVLVLLLPSLIACHYVLIAPEESYLASKFGEEYRSYVATVHRWIGRA
jgi:protein-S-isoprenylcysteine O-methyltransferase Ste14